MLETWEAGVNFPIVKGKQSKPIKVAQLLGWIRIRKASDTPQLNATASACNAPYALILPPKPPG